jgi:hypothetical protein
MNLRTLLLLLATFSMGACATGYREVLPGVNSAGQLQVTVAAGWNQAPALLTPSARRLSKTFTQDGLLLDRLILIPGVRDGETIFDSDRSAALPLFRADMLPNELEELTESSILKLYGEGAATVSTENLRPHGFGSHSGVLFDIRAAVTESPDYRGLVAAIIAEEKLYMVMFLAADPYYFDKHIETVEAIINSLAIRVPTIKSTGGI